MIRRAAIAGALLLASCGGEEPWVGLEVIGVSPCDGAILPDGRSLDLRPNGSRGLLVFVGNHVDRAVTVEELQVRLVAPVRFGELEPAPWTAVEGTVIGPGGHRGLAIEVLDEARRAAMIDSFARAPEPISAATFELQVAAAGTISGGHPVISPTFEDRLVVCDACDAAKCDSGPD